MSTPRPVALRLDGLDLVIQWNNGVTTRYPPSLLRKNCPCAGCLELRAAQATAPAKQDQAIALREVTPVGNYAYKIAFSDGHDTGIFTLEYLYQLGSPAG